MGDTSPGCLGRRPDHGPAGGWHLARRRPLAQPCGVADAAAVGGAPACNPVVAYLVGWPRGVVAAGAAVGERLGFVTAGHVQAMRAELDALQRAAGHRRGPAPTRQPRPGPKPGAACRGAATERKAAEATTYLAG